MSMAEHYLAPGAWNRGPKPGPPNTEAPLKKNNVKIALEFVVYIYNINWTSVAVYFQLKFQAN